MPKRKSKSKPHYAPSTEGQSPDYDAEFNHSAYQNPKESAVAGGYVINHNNKTRINYLRFDKETGWLYRKTEVEQDYHNLELEKLLNKNYQIWNNGGAGKPYHMIELLAGGYVFLPRKKQHTQPLNQF